MQSVSSRIWTRVAVSISYDDNHYSTGTSHKKIKLKKDNLILKIKDAYMNQFWGHMKI